MPRLNLLRFTLRDLFWATLVAALGLGWWVHARQMRAELAATQSDLLYQADYVDQFVSCFKNLKCEIPGDDDPRCANGGPYTRIFFPDFVTKATGCLSSTLSGPCSGPSTANTASATATPPPSKPPAPPPAIAAKFSGRGPCHA
jgi:hypothetical protein